MSIDEQHVALPRLYGAPAYARPAVVAASPRPFDPDDLPIEALQDRDDREFAATLPVRAWSAGGTVTKRAEKGSARRRDAKASGPTLRPQPLSLRSIAGKLLNRD